jgi:hypothetical protein
MLPRLGSKLRDSAALISRFKKERYLKAMSEDDFRDRVIRPLFYRLGLQDGRDLCGPDEEGKDALFVIPDPLGFHDLVVVQTKAGNLNLASRAQDNLLNAIAQLRTASQTAIALIKSKQKRLPAKVILCASGTINNAARKHIADEVRFPNLNFLDASDLIPQIDEQYPELWLDVDADVMPYMRGLRKAIEQSSESVVIAELLPTAGAAATDNMFIDLVLWRNTVKVRRRSGKAEQVPDLLEVPITGIMHRPERLVLVLGEAGAGKSTSIRRLAYVLAGNALSGQTNFQIPVLIRAVDIARRTDERLLEIAISEAARVSTLKRAPFGTDELQAGNVVILVDALDEVAIESDRLHVVASILQFHSEFPECLIVLTSREYGFVKNLGELDQFARYRVRQISFKQAEQIVQKLEKKGSLPADTSKELIRRLEDIHGMDLNPLLVTVFAATTEYARQDIPANITELFKKFTEMMLGRWDASKGFAQQFHAPLKDFILKKLAFEMHLERVTSTPLTTIRSRIAAELRERGYETDVDALIDEIITRSGLLRVVGDEVEFRHLLLQEFFAGRGIPSENLLETFIFDDWWRRSVVFYFGERPSDINALNQMRSKLASRTPSERFTAAGTLGLALQACYLSPVSEKIDAMVDVIETLSDVKDDVVATLPGAERFPLSRFLAYYLYARDSVALNALDQHAAGMIESWRSEGLSEDRSDLRTFWVIVGLLESGKVTDAEPLIKTFHPADPRLLLAIHLGCILIQHIRVSSADQKKSAKRICACVADDVSHLKRLVFDEFRTEMLEIRRGEVKAITGRS